MAFLITMGLIFLNEMRQLLKACREEETYMEALKDNYLVPQRPSGPPKCIFNRSRIISILEEKCSYTQLLYRSVLDHVNLIRLER